MALDLFRVEGGLEIDGAVQILEGAGVPTLDAFIGSTYHRTDSPSGIYVKVAAGSGADKWELQAAVSYVTQQIAAVNTAVNNLGNAFNYVGTLAGGAQGSPFDLSTLPVGGKDAGDYYKVTTSGWFVIGAGTPFYANLFDGLVWNTVGGVDKIDNTNSEVSGTTNFVDVTGTADTGFVVDLDAGFKGRVTTVESNLAAEITARAAADTVIAASVTAEASARGAADTTLQNNINAEITARTAGDATNAAAILAEQTARVAADAAQAADLLTEVTARIAGDAANAAAILAEQTARTSADTTITNNLNTEITARIAAVLAEVTARTAGDAQNAADILAEVTARTAADVTLQNNINTEITARTAGDAAQAAALLVEVTARMAGDAANAAAILAEQTARTSADTTITNNLTNLTTVVNMSGLQTVGSAVTTLSDTVAAGMTKWVVYVQQVSTPANVTAYEVFAATNGASADFSRFSILRLGSAISGLNTSVALSAGDLVLSVSTGVSCNITIKRVAAA